LRDISIDSLIAPSESSSPLAKLDMVS
jgi:hypothetical protein